MIVNEKALEAFFSIAPIPSGTPVSDYHRALAAFVDAYETSKPEKIPADQVYRLAKRAFRILHPVATIAAWDECQSEYLDMAKVIVSLIKEEKASEVEAWRNRCHAADRDYQELMEKYLAIREPGAVNETS